MGRFRLLTTATTITTKSRWIKQDSRVSITTYISLPAEHAESQYNMYNTIMHILLLYYETRLKKGLDKLRPVVGVTA
jgi:hypothetical protein